MSVGLARTKTVSPLGDGADRFARGESPAEVVGVPFVRVQSQPVLEICPRGNNKLVIIIFPCS